MGRVSDRPCPIHGCDWTVRLGQLLCKKHWFMVPTARRNEIWRLYRQENASVAHRRACDEAIAEVERLEADRAGLRKVGA